jgi:hypothetical protein
MSSKYSVVQFTPDLIAGERINIGVVVASGSDVRVRFLGDWGRVRQFYGQDVAFLKHFARSMMKGASSQTVLSCLANAHIDESAIASACESWTNSIQFTPLRASLKSADALLEEVAARFLSDAEHVTRAYRDRRVAASAAASKIRLALSQRVGNTSAESLLKKRHSLAGKLQEHKFDAVVANGIDYMAAQGISFEVPVSSTLHRETEALAWQITDVLSNSPGLPIAVVALPPKNTASDYDKSMQLYEECADVYRKLGAQVEDENSIAKWADHYVANVPLQATA